MQPRQPGTSLEASKRLLERNEQWIPGGVVSLNRRCDPNIAFARGLGSRVWDLDGNEYLDYHAGFSAAFLGHNDPDVNGAVERVLREQRPLMGAVASRLSDVVIVTSDNPRSEPPEAILEEIQRGMNGGRKAERHAIVDRREAIASREQATGKLAGERR